MTFKSLNGKLMLTPMQAAHVAAVFPESKAQMSNYLAAGVEVVVGPQTECGQGRGAARAVSLAGVQQ